MYWVDSHSVVKFENSLRARGLDYEKTPQDCIWVDFGGAVFIKEPRLEFEANGVKFGTFVRHLPAFEHALSLAAEDPHISDCVRVSAGPRSGVCVLDPKTIEELKPIVNGLAQEKMSEIDRAEREIEDVFSGHPGLRRQAKCSVCGSNKPYIECCGGPTKTN